MDDVFRSGFSAFVGRPNAGKSTLTNALVGSKIVITSDKPQTTRFAVRGIVNRPNAQLVLVDTPGLHRPRTLLGERLNEVVHDTLDGVDVIAFCIPAGDRIGPGDRYIAAQIAKLNTPVVAVVTKIDTVNKTALAGQLLAVAALGDFVEIVPVSAVSGDQVELLADLLAARMPIGPAMYPDEMSSDMPTKAWIAELIREAALDGVRDELPHSIAVTIEEMNPREGRDDMLDIFATLHVERSSQKGIIIGHQGSRLRELGIVARRQIEAQIGTRIHLDLHVKVLQEWQRDPKKLDRLGF
jgi:GTP-binding protein Era